MLYPVPLVVMDKKKPCGPGGKPGHATGEDTGFPHSLCFHWKKGETVARLLLPWCCLQLPGARGGVIACFFIDSRSHVHPWIVLSLLFPNSAFHQLSSQFFFTSPYLNLILLNELFPIFNLYTHCFLHICVLSGTWVFYDLMLRPGGGDSFSTRRQELLLWASCHSDAPRPLCPPHCWDLPTSHLLLPSFLERSGSSLTPPGHDQGQLQHSSYLQSSLTLSFIYTPWQLNTNSERPPMGKKNQSHYVAKGGRTRIHGKMLKRQVSAVNQEEILTIAVPCWERVLCLLTTESVWQKSPM